jgi:hypothetical protein
MYGMTQTGSTRQLVLAVIAMIMMMAAPALAGLATQPAPTTTPMQPTHVTPVDYTLPTIDRPAPTTSDVTVTEHTPTPQQPAPVQPQPVVHDDAPTPQPDATPQPAPADPDAPDPDYLTAADCKANESYDAEQQACTWTAGENPPLTEADCYPDEEWVDGGCKLVLPEPEAAEPTPIPEPEVPDEETTPEPEITEPAQP